jgi:uncharacterized protein (UPF0276 family)
LNRYPLEAVRQIHLAGHTQVEDYLFDTHDQPVCSPVLELTKSCLHQMREKNIPVETVPIILEWDDAKTPFEKLLIEFNRIQDFVKEPLFEEYAKLG